MKESMKRDLRRFVEEEQKAAVNEELLHKLREMATQELTYWELPAEDRNALNQFFNEMKDAYFAQLFEGKYGAQVILDAIIVKAFEVGRSAHGQY